MLCGLMMLHKAFFGSMDGRFGRSTACRDANPHCVHSEKKKSTEKSTVASIIEVVQCNQPAVRYWLNPQGSSAMLGPQR